MAMLQESFKIPMDIESRRRFALVRTMLAQTHPDGAWPSGGDTWLWLLVNAPIDEWYREFVLGPQQVQDQSVQANQGETSESVPNVPEQVPSEGRPADSASADDQRGEDGGPRVGGGNVGESGG